jgi:hypothetical protein
MNIKTSTPAVRLTAISFGIALLMFVSSGSSRAGSVSVNDFDISAFAADASPITATISAMWGTYSGGAFTPLLSFTQSAQNTGYLDGSDNEFVVAFIQSDNSIIAADTPMFVSIFNVPGGAGTSTWSSSAEQIVLSDPTWVAPTFTLTQPQLDWALTSSTVAMSLAQFGGSTGTYNFNDGAPQVTLVPEPSTYALLGLAGLALGGYAMRRRKRA